MPFGEEDHSDAQRREARAGARALAQPPRRAAQRGRPYRNEEGLRRGRLRRLHRPGRRQAAQFVSHARGGGRRPRGRHHRRNRASIAGAVRPARRRAMRLLHAGDDRDGEGAARREPATDRGGDPLRHRREHLPLHRIHPDRRSDPGRREGNEEVSDFSVIGESLTRPDMPGKVSGRAQYAGDLSLPGMLHAKTKRSNVAHARIKRIDAASALACEGVKAVLTHHDVPRVLHYGSPHPRSASVTKDQYILDSTVRYWGESVAVVAAVSEEIAEEALDLIEVEYEELPALLTVEAALSS